MQNRTNNFLSFLLTAFLISVLSGCVSVEGPNLKITKNFIPKKLYAYNYDQMLDKVLSVVKKEKIMLASISKESGIISTDYIQGPTVDIAVLVIFFYRYKYQISFEKVNPYQTQVEVTCKLEKREMLKGGSAGEAVEQLRPWVDVTYQEKQTAANYERWLYEQIEKSL